MTSAAAPDQRHLLPALTHNVRSNEWGVFFFGAPGYLSQWADAPISLPPYRYTSAEQGMMHQKALLFQDHSSAACILTAEHPREQKRLGRKVSGFTEERWREHREEVVYRVNLAKFSQHPLLRAALLSTGERYIAECSPFDAVWGTGTDVSTAVQLGSVEEAERSWRGENLLGTALMKVRATLREECGSHEDTT